MTDVREEARAAWDSVCTEIAGAKTRLNGFRPTFARGMADGLSLRREIAEFAAGMETARWTWPAFDRWLETFSTWGEWPHMWQPVAEALAEDMEPENRAVALRNAAACLIPHTAMARFYVAQHAENFVRLVPRGWTLRLVFIDDNGGPAERRAAEPFRARIECGDLSMRPPFFPGDRTTVQAVPPAGQRSAPPVKPTKPGFWKQIFARRG